MAKITFRKNLKEFSSIKSGEYVFSGNDVFICTHIHNGARMLVNLNGGGQYTPQEYVLFETIEGIITIEQ